MRDMFLELLGNSVTVRCFNLNILSTVHSAQRTDVSR